MHNSEELTAAEERNPQRLFVFNGGFLTQTSMRRILALSGYDIRLGKPGPGDMIGVWGQSPTSPRGEKVSDWTDAAVVRVEDAFLRSVLPGRSGQTPLGLQIDHSGVHFDPTHPSDLEKILSGAALDDTVLLDRARAAIDRIRATHLSKYNAFDLTIAPPAPGYVLVIDQTKGDAAVKASRADRNTFREMLYFAQEEHPSARIIIKTHPETAAGHRDGYFTEDDCTGNVSLFDHAISPWALFEGAIGVYTVSSQMGFEAILAGHKPHVFGQPFYMGWGLTDDRQPLDRRQRNLTKAQLFAAAMILYPNWYDPFHDRLCTLEDALGILEAEAREWRDDHKGWIAGGMRLWKRQPLQAFFGNYKNIRFKTKPNGAARVAQEAGRPLMVWAGKSTDQTIGAKATRVEDGFLRSVGLGADLTPPLSLVCDDLGIYYDPSQPSRLEHLIAARETMPEWARKRADLLVRKLNAAGLSKYNLDSAGYPERLPVGRRILVPGQVEDDASICLGAGDINTNQALLEAARKANPAAIILYKPHPDVEAGLRPGRIDNPEQIADAILEDTDPITAINLADEVWTMTSTLGFEALLRGKQVTCFGQPFYSGWGLTNDRGVPLPRRSARPDILGLAHAVLIDYPRYFDPLTQRACPVEVIVDRISQGHLPERGPFNRSLAKVQGIFASYAWIWR